MLRALVTAGLLVVLTPALAHAAGRAPGRAIVTGAYENTLMIGYDPATGVVTGYFDMQQDGPPVITCLFELEGRLAGASAAVQALDPTAPGDHPIHGTLKMEAGGKVAVSLSEDPAGCGNVWSFTDPDLDSFALETAHAWTSVRVVKSARAYLYPTAGAAAHGRAYLVGFDGVGVVAARPGWVQIEYPGARRLITGWLPEGDLYAAP
jgi:hypothetical protein